MNPYWGKSFTQFFPLFFHRLFLFITGQLSWTQLASDEIQVLVLGCISMAAALIGTLLVLKRMTMLANSLSHTILVGIITAYLFLSSHLGTDFAINFKVLIIAAIITGIVTTLLTQFLHHVIKLQEDASIGIVFTSLFALGIVMVTLFTRNAHIGLEVVMGNADALHRNDLVIAFAIVGVNAFFVSLFFKEWKLVCFDQGLAKSFGFYPSIFNYLLMFLASATAISAFRAVGVLLFLAFLVGLPLTARLLSHHLHTNLFLSSALGWLISLLGVALSRHMLSVYYLPLSTAGITVCLIGLSFLVAIGLKTQKRYLTLRKNPG